MSKATEDQKGLLGHLMYTASQVAKKEIGEGYRLVVNDGKNACKSISYCFGKKLIQIFVLL